MASYHYAQMKVPPRWHPVMSRHFPSMSRHFPSISRHFPSISRHFPSLPVISRHFPSLPVTSRQLPVNSPQSYYPCILSWNTFHLTNIIPSPIWDRTTTLSDPLDSYIWHREKTKKRQKTWWNRPHKAHYRERQEAWSEKSWIKNTLPKFHGHK